jgi:hypothetical protein
MLLAKGGSWKANANTKLSQLRSAVQLLLRHTNLPDLDQAMVVSPAASSRHTENHSPSNMFTDLGSTTMSLPSCVGMRRDSTAEPDLLIATGLATAPMLSLYNLNTVRTLSNSMRCSPVPTSPEDDFIAQGLLPLIEAEELFVRYMQDICQYTWAGILFPYESLEAVRQKSSLLTAAVLTIAALNMGREEATKRCYGIFVARTTNTCLSRPQNLDDIRAQALAAFYLPDLSWKLSGLAVRNAVELNLHQAFQRLMRGHEEERENARLWYALYVCEHQCSIAYGRPPTIHHDTAIRNVEHFLDSSNTKPGDIELCAQVSLFKILTEAYNTYGSDPECLLTEADLQQLRFFNFAIEEWRSAWEARSNLQGTRSQPPQGIVLYYHFVRVHLNSLALRALHPPSATPFDTLSYDRLEAANVSIAAATNVLILILEDSDVNPAMPIVSVFTHTMVTFCATFLLKTMKTWGGVTHAQSPLLSSELALGLNIDIERVLSLSRKSSNFLAKVAEKSREKHSSDNVVQDINDLLENLEHVTTRFSTHTSPTTGMSGTDPLQTSNGVAMATGYDMHKLVSFVRGPDASFLDRLAATNLDFWDTGPLY